MPNKATEDLLMATYHVPRPSQEEGEGLVRMRVLTLSGGRRGSGTYEGLDPLRRKERVWYV